MVKEQKIVIAILGFFILTACLGLSELAGPYGDNGRYIVLARSLAQGTGLRLINYPSEPIEAKIPPLYPLFLAFLISAFGYHMIVLKAGSIALMGLALYFFYAALRTAGLRRNLALAVLCLSAVNPYTIEYGREVLSEAPFMFLVSLAVFLWAGYEKRGRGIFLLGSLLAAVCAALVRDAGLVLIGCLAGLLLVRKNYLFFVISAGTGAGLSCLWLFRNLYTRAGYLYEFIGRGNYLAPSSGLISPLALAQRYAYEACAYIGDILPDYVFPCLRMIAPHSPLWPGKIAGGVLFLIAALAGFTLLYRNKSSRLLAVFPVTYALCLPLFATYGIRYLAVIGFFIFAALAVAADRLLQRTGPKVAAGLAAVFLAVNMGTVIPQISFIRQGYPGAWQQYCRALAFIKKNADPGAVVVCRKEFIGFVVSERKTLGFAHVPDADRSFLALRDSAASHVIIDALDSGANSPGRAYLLAAIRKYPMSFRLVWRHDAPLTEVYEIIR